MSRGERPLRLAMLGTRGVPARYGGFETAVEEVGRRLVERGHEVRVYCREADEATYLGMERVELAAVKSRSLETLSHTALSVRHLITHRTDAAFLFNAGNSVVLPALRARRIPVATHVDGLEWKRAKWEGLGQQYYRVAESMAVRWSDALIADAVGIQQYYLDEFDAETRLITYGAPKDPDPAPHRLRELGLSPDAYHLVVARMEPENHVLEIVQGYAASDAQLPLVVVGSAPYAAEYTQAVERVAAGDPRIRMLGGVWDQALLDSLYVNAATYLHGHSVGGTNPSLLRAIGGGTPTIAFDVIFNREVLGSAGCYFATPDELGRQVVRLEHDAEDRYRRGVALRHRADAYDWDDIASDYEALAQDLVRRRVPGPQRARRLGASDWASLDADALGSRLEPTVPIDLSDLRRDRRVVQDDPVDLDSHDSRDLRAG